MRRQKPRRSNGAPPKEPPSRITLRYPKGESVPTTVPFEGWRYALVAARTGPSPESILATFEKWIRCNARR